MSSICQSWKCIFDIVSFCKKEHSSFFPLFEIIFFIWHQGLMRRNSLMRKRKYSFRLIQIRFVTSKTLNSVDRCSRVHMSMFICVFGQLRKVKTDSQIKTKSILAAHANSTFTLWRENIRIWKQMPTRIQTSDNRQANIYLYGWLINVKWIYMPFSNVRKENSQWIKTKKGKKYA